MIPGIALRNRGIDPENDFADRIVGIARGGIVYNDRPENLTKEVLQGIYFHTNKKG